MDRSPVIRHSLCRCYETQIHLGVSSNLSKHPSMFTMGIRWRKRLGPLMKGHAGVLILAVFLPCLLSGCSLLQLRLPGEPLSRKELNTRQRTREFASSFSATVPSAADQIIATAKDPEVQDAARDWKVGASSAMRKAAWRTSPILALVDTWALAKQMADYFETGPGTNAFGAQQAFALTNALALEKTIAATARSVLARDEFQQAQRFVTNYAQSFPLRSLAFDREPVATQWALFQGEELLRTVGTTSDVVSDMSDRLKAFSEQIPDELRWRMEKPLAQLDASLAEMRKTFTAFDASLERLTTAAEGSPVVVSNAVFELRNGFLPVLERFEKQWGATLVTFQQEREALTRNFSTERAALTQSLDKELAAILVAVDKQVAVLVQTLEKERAAVLVTVEKERTAVMQDVDRIVRETTERSWQQLRAMVRDVLFYLVLLVIIVLGLPFFFGFLVGRTLGRRGKEESATAAGGRPPASTSP